MSFVPVARLDEIPTDRGLRVEIDGIAIGLYRDDREGGRIHAMEDACPHAGFPLSEGDFTRCVVTCQAHGWRYDVRTGFDPDHPDGFPIPCFAVRVVEGQVEVDLETRVNDPRRSRATRRD